MKTAVIIGAILIVGMLTALLFVPARTIEETLPRQENQFTNMRLTSPVFNNNEPIPAKYTCDGDNINPPLSIADVPTGTKSLVLIMDDPDATAKALQPGSGQAWVHWIIWNLDPATTEIKEGTMVPEAHLGMTSFGKPGYGGPCPPVGRHCYFHKLYALDALLPDLKQPAKAALEKAMRGHVIGQAELIGLYQRGR